MTKKLTVTEKSETTTISLLKTTVERLKLLGHIGDKYEDIVIRLVELNDRVPKVLPLVTEIAHEGLTRGDTSTKKKISSNIDTIRKLLAF